MAPLWLAGFIDVPTLNEESFEISMEPSLVAIHHFQRQLAKYKDYCGGACRDSNVVAVSFQCLIGNQQNELAEIVGVVAL